MIDAIVRERNQNGIYRNFRDFVERLSGKELNKRTIENFIKAGALDGLCDNRKQLMMIYVQVVDSVNQEKKMQWQVRCLCLTLWQRKIKRF